MPTVRQRGGARVGLESSLKHALSEHHSCTHVSELIPLPFLLTQYPAGPQTPAVLPGVLLG